MQPLAGAGVAGTECIHGCTPTSIMTRLPALLLAACSLAVPVQAEEPPRAALDDARKASTELVTTVRSELLKAIEASGPLRAIVVGTTQTPSLFPTLALAGKGRVLERLRRYA